MSSLSTLDSEDLETAVAGERATPATEMERVIAGVWQEVLGLDAVGAEENFFDLGGHSLALVAAYERLRPVVGERLTVMELFEHPSVRRLARHLGGAEAEADGGGARERARKQKAARQQKRTAQGGER